MYFTRNRNTPATWAIILEGGEDSPISLTTVHDFCNVVARAVEYEGEWPFVGGIRGDEVTVAQLIAIGEKVRGMFNTHLYLTLEPG